MKKSGNQQTMKQINRSIVLNAIRMKGPISRVDLARLTELSPTTVSVIVEEAIKEGLVVESGTVGHGVGRKMTLLQIHAESGYVLGVDLSRFICVLLNLNGDVVAAQPMRRLVGEAEIHRSLIGEIDRFAEQHHLNWDLIRWMGLSVPGIIDPDSQMVLLSRNLQIEQLDLKQLLAQHFSCTIHLVNDLDAAGFAERYSGAAQGKRTIVYVLIDQGVGAGIVINDQIYRGISGQAGTLTDFQPYATGTLAQKIKAQQPSLFEGLNPDETLAEWVRRARQGQEPFCTGLHRVKEGIADSCRMILHLFNPEMMIISGWITSDNQLFQQCRTLIGHGAHLFPPTPIQDAYWKEKGPAIGAAALGLHHMFRLKTVE